MMSGLVDEVGRFRKGGVGVFDGSKAIHIAPPADRVPALMADLFAWLGNAEDHLLVRSCVFHYEFAFIHPFADGNGRTGRLWQSLILGKLHPLFEHPPVKNMLYSNQQGYYDGITRSSDFARSLTSGSSSSMNATFRIPSGHWMYAEYDTFRRVCKRYLKKQKRSPK